MTKTEINHRIQSIEIAALGMGVPLNQGQRNAIANLRAKLADTNEEN